MDDSEIKKLLVSRDEYGLALCEACYGDACRRLSFSLLGSREDAQEVFNDALLSVWNTVPPKDPPSLFSYFAAIVRTKSVDILRGRTRQKRGGGIRTDVLEELDDVLPDYGADGRDIPDKIALTGALNVFLDALSAEARTVFLKRYWWMLPIRQIARETGRSESAVKMQLARIREKLREFLEREGFLI